MAKKIQKYVPLTKFPGKGGQWRLLDESSKYQDFYFVMDLLYSKVSPNNLSYNNYYQDLLTKFKSGELNVADWKQYVNVWTRQSLFNQLWPHTDEYNAINNAFMLEYSQRADLQEIYVETAAHNHYFYDKYGAHHNSIQARTNGWFDAPESYMMFQAVIARSTDASKKIELSRETPYLEGDLVLLRKPFVGRRGVDPLYVNPYSEEARNGATTPDASTMRIGTVVGVTERVGNYYATKGSKVIQLIWMGVEDSQIIDVEERFIKWHERPTYKNGMKKRPENRE